MSVSQVSQTDTPPVTSVPVETECPEPRKPHLKELFFLVECLLDLQLQLP